MSRQKNKLTGVDGFTLIELLVVIAIISFLSTIIMTGVSVARQKSRDTLRISNMKTIRTALELYYNDFNGYPSTGGGYQSECVYWGGYTADQVIPGLAPVYINRVPSDPFMRISEGGIGNNCYIYLSDGTDYAFVDIGTDINLMGHPNLIDPTRDLPVGNNCLVDGTPTAWKVSSDGWRCG
jgi:prepilin-type N-terminal cleavage/methylation domain-containing protein